LILLNPFAPHMTEELWEMSGYGGQIAQAAWPVYDESKCAEAEVEIVIQINGKVRARTRISADAATENVLAAAKAEPAIAEAITGKRIVKELYVPGKLVNIVAAQ
ncbi:MAG: class I tRNA ligase family protein, partial [Oscillospiraceae bacterium]|nr:class I tRNA ligase family protein [Oscillospiraceae bacterium]